MRDTTVTIHPTVKQSVNSILYYVSVEQDMAMGKVLEDMLKDSPKYQEAMKKYRM